MSSWNGSGRPVCASATTSPSRISGAPRSSRRTSPTTSGRLAVTSESRRVQMATRSPSPCTCTRAPSYLYSSAVRPPCATRSSEKSVPVSASIGDSGTKRRGATRVSPAAPCARARTATAEMSPRKSAARLTASGSAPAISPIAPSTPPAEIPVRISPPMIRATISRSRADARAANAASRDSRRWRAPGPLASATAAKASATSASVSGAAAEASGAAGRPRTPSPRGSDAGRGRPVRNATAGATSSAWTRVRNVATRCCLSSRPRLASSARQSSANSANGVMSAGAAGRAPPMPACRPLPPGPRQSRAARRGGLPEGDGADPSVAPRLRRSLRVAGGHALDGGGRVRGRLAECPRDAPRQDGLEDRVRPHILAMTHRRVEDPPLRVPPGPRRRVRRTVVHVVAPGGGHARRLLHENHAQVLLVGLERVPLFHELEALREPGAAREARVGARHLRGLLPTVRDELGAEHPDVRVRVVGGADPRARRAVERVGRAMSTDESFALSDRREEPSLSRGRHRRGPVRAGSGEIAGGVKEEGVVRRETRVPEDSAILGVGDRPAARLRERGQNGLCVAWLIADLLDHAVLVPGRLREEENLLPGRSGGAGAGRREGGTDREAHRAGQEFTPRNSACP